MLFYHLRYHIQSFYHSLCNTTLAPPSSPQNTNNLQKHIKSTSKLTLLSQLVLFAIVLMNIFSLGNSSFMTKTFNVIVCLLYGWFIIVPYHKMSKLYQTLYNSFVVIYGFAMLHIDQLSPLIMLFELQVFPLLALSLTKSKYSFLVQSFVQLIYSQKYISSLMINVVNEFNPIATIQEISNASNILVIVQTILILSIFRSFEDSYKQRLSSERKLREFKKQKDFLLGFSHEFRNLTHSIVGNIKLAVLQDISDEVKSLLLRAEVSGELLLQYINNILDSGKLELDELEITPAPTRIHDVLKQVWRVSSELIKLKGLLGSIRVSDKVPSVLHIDNYRIVQILFNLVSNGIKYTNRGSVNVLVEWIERQNIVTDACFEPLSLEGDESEYDEGLYEKWRAFTVFDETFLFLDPAARSITQRSNSDQTSKFPGILKITVSDTGCGIPSNNISKLWDQFWKPSNDSSERRYGTGLGLFITKHLCKCMGGDIKVFSRVEKGSSFVFCIPTKPAQIESEGETDAETVKALIRQRQLKAMVVDDVQFNNLILKNFFEKLDIEVVDMAGDGLEAYMKYIKQIQNHTPVQIITMDIDMPKMDGKKAAQKIREYEADHNLQPSILIMISGDCLESDIRQCTDKNGRIRADGFLKKPANMEELVRVVGSTFT